MQQDRCTIKNKQLKMNFKIAEKSVFYGNAIKDKSFDFTVRIIKLYKYFRKNEASLDPILK